MVLLSALLCPALNQDMRLSSPLWNLLIISLNYIYFNKRKEYFIY